MSYTNLVYHIVFRTYRSIPAIDEEHERELYAYAHGYITRHRAKLYRIGGMPDHVHLLVSLPPDLAVSEFVRGLKYATNSWLKGNASFSVVCWVGRGIRCFHLLGGADSRSKAVHHQSERASSAGDLCRRIQALHPGLWR